MPYVEVIIDRLMFKSIRKIGVFTNIGQHKYTHLRFPKTSNFLLLDVELVSPVFCNNATLFNPFGLLTRREYRNQKNPLLYLSPCLYCPNSVLLSVGNIFLCSGGGCCWFSASKASNSWEYWSVYCKHHPSMLAHVCVILSGNPVNFDNFDISTGLQLMSVIFLAKSVNLICLRPLPKSHSKLNPMFWQGVSPHLWQYIMSLPKHGF